MAEEKIKRLKAKSKGLTTLGVPAGSILTLTCKTVDDNQVEYQGKVYSISGLAKELMRVSISGYHAFKYNGTLLAKLCSKEESNSPEGTSIPQKPADTAQSAVQAPSPQTVPLPRPSDALVKPQEAVLTGGTPDDRDIDPLINL